MKDNMEWDEIGWMKQMVKIDLLLSISFSVFGMLLIFGLGFVFPTINPYVVIKWIIIVAGVVFLFSLVKYIILMGKKMMMKGGKKSAKK